MSINAPCLGFLVHNRIRLNRIKSKSDNDNDPQCSLVKSKQNCSVSDASYLAIQEVIDIDMLALNRH